MQVTPSLNVGGVEAVTLDIARAVAGQGARSLVASRGGDGAAGLARYGAEWIAAPVHARDPLTVAINIARLAAVIRRERVSLVHVRSRAPAFSAIAAARRAGVPVVASYHGIYGARTSLKRWYNGIMTRGDLVIANSAFTRDHVVAEHDVAAHRIVVVPEGIDTALFDPAAVSPARVQALRAAWGLAGGRRRVILAPARLTAWKGQIALVEAFGRRPTRGDAVLVLTGRPDDHAYVDKIMAAATRFDVLRHVRFVGAVSDMPAAYALADVVAAPSLKPESFGRSVVEAGAMGRAVLASDLGGPAETVVHDQTGWLIAPGDIGAWTRALDKALATPSRDLARMGEAARVRVIARYDLAVTIEATFAVYRRLVEARGA